MVQQMSCSMIASMFEMWLFWEKKKKKSHLFCNFCQSNCLFVKFSAFYKYWLDVASAVKPKSKYSEICYRSWFEPQSALLRLLLIKAFLIAGALVCVCASWFWTDSNYFKGSFFPLLCRCDTQQMRGERQWRWLIPPNTTPVCWKWPVKTFHSFPLSPVEVWQTLCSSSAWYL